MSNEAISDTVLDGDSTTDLADLEAEALEGLDLEGVETTEEMPDFEEGDEVEDSEQEPKTEEPEEKEDVPQDTKTKLFAKLQNAEAQRLEAQSRVSELEQAVQYYQQNMPTPEQLKEFAGSNPKEFLSYFFGEGDQLAQAMLSVFQGMPYEGDEVDDGPVADPRIDEALRMAKEANDKLAAQQYAEEQRFLTTQVEQAFSEIDAAITPETTPILNSLRQKNSILPNGSMDLVFQKAASLYKQTGQVYSFAEVALAMEEVLTEDLGGLAPSQAQPEQVQVKTDKGAQPAGKKYPSLRQKGSSTYTPPANASLKELEDDVLKNFQWED